MDDLLAEFLDSEKNKRARNTYENRRTGLRAFQEWLDATDTDVLEVGPLKMEDFVGWLVSEEGRSVADGTAAKYVDQVSRFYQYLDKRMEEEFGENDVFENPVAEADIREIIDPSESKMARELHSEEGYVALDPEHYERFTDHIPSPTSRNQLLFQLMWDCGLRPEEVIHIRIADIDREHQEIGIRSNKTHLNRTVFFGDTVAQMIRIWLDGGERARFNPSQRSPYLIVTQQSEQISPKTIQEIFRNTIQQAEIETEPQYTDAKGNGRYRYSPYSLRHGYAERMVDKVDLETLRDIMGHKSIETTKQYLNPDKEERREKIQGALDG